ncbi:MAG: hypothetical protein E6H84_05000 [Chloroflexi bacterium]|nr:MAG: hypothetical protein E6H84_05000 [Chloroflexota bacterium]
MAPARRRALPRRPRDADAWAHPNPCARARARPSARGPRDRAQLNDDLGSGAVLLVAYTLGLGVPFLLLAGGIGGARRIARWLASHIRAVNLAGGTLVIVMGLVLVSGQFAKLPQLFNFLPLLG